MLPRPIHLATRRRVSQYPPSLFKNGLSTSNIHSLPETCPADTGLNKWQFDTDFTSGSSSFSKWNVTAGTVESTSLGAKFSISEQGDAPTIESEFYIFFGRVDVNFRAANGTGIISTMVMESDDLDEIDWVSDSWIDSNQGRGSSSSCLTYSIGANQHLRYFH